jgi:hypothetical protein
LLDGYAAQGLMIKKLQDRIEFYKAGPKPEMGLQEMEDGLREGAHRPPYRPSWWDWLMRLIRK